MKKPHSPVISVVLASLALAVLLVSGTAAAAVEKTLRDQMGRQVTLPVKVEKLVVIPIPLASMVMALDGGAARLSGINAAARSDIDEGLLGRMFPAATRIPSRVAGESFAPNGEALAAARPDLVIQWGDQGDAIVTPIRQLGLPVLTLKYGDSRWAADWLRLTGAAIGKGERGEKLATWFETRMTEIERRAAAIPAASRPRVLYLMRGRGALIVAGKNTSMDGDIARVGGVNPAAKLPGFAPVGVEQILAWNPDIILLNNFERDLSPQAFYADSRFRGLAAVTKKRVYRYPRGGFRWDPPSQETPLAQDWLYGVLHPDRKMPDLRARIAVAYQMLYGYSVSAAEIDRILRCDENGQSAHYLNRFGGKP
ncbi:MAG: ABC transporter substrate-binding protein [Zoogloeaceae bacterium]|jgi:iron complex transport system substrate-binding protein|nr:ABC transporter substrate-binding protein [Zoogloeaceae bacterium]